MSYHVQPSHHHHPSSSFMKENGFVRFLIRAFSMAALIMGIFVVWIMMWDTTKNSNGDGDGDGDNSLSYRSHFSSRSRSGNHWQGPRHEWALAKFGFPSAFDDSLYDTDPNHDHDHKINSPNVRLKCVPQRLHLTQATNVNVENLVNMTLSFTLPYEDCAHVDATILYGRGLFPEGSSKRSEILQFTYNISSFSSSIDDSSETFQSDWIHHVTLPFLHAGRQSYWYRIQVYENTKISATSSSLMSSSPSIGPKFLATAPEQDVFVRRRRQQQLELEHEKRLLGESKAHRFLTPPMTNQPTSLALVGDLGQTENSTKTMHHIYQATMQDASMSVPPVSAFVIAGDLSYADGDPHRWTSWLDLMEPLLRSTPLFTVPGNHEVECDGNTHQVFEQYESYFRNPNRLAKSDRQPIPDDYRKNLWSCLTPSEFLGHYNYGNAFWSVQHGMVHMIGLNSYTSTLPESPQYQWLDYELQHVDRSVTPWLLVFFHCPLHTTFLGHNHEINPRVMLETIEPLLVQYHVNIVVSGHDHAYLRTKPMNGMKVDKSGPIYLTLGAGGNREQHNRGFIHTVPEEWVMKRDLSEYGFGQLNVPNATHAHFRWVRDGTTTEGIRDSVWLSNLYFL